MPKLDGKISLVTGGTSGIGLAAANALAKEGAHVYITGRREPELRTAVQQIGRNATGVRGDVSNADAPSGIRGSAFCTVNRTPFTLTLKIES